jgi:hypothetical protein
MAGKKTSLYLTDTITSKMVKINSIISKESHTKHQIPACLAKNYILTSHHCGMFSVFSKEK